MSRKILAHCLQGGGDEGLNVADVFSTYLYEGTEMSQNLVNGINLANEGGLVWLKDRDEQGDHLLFDTERGVNQVLRPNQNITSSNLSLSLNKFNTDGFSIKGRDDVNLIGSKFSSWTFRKAPKFFDIVKYTGDGIPSNHNRSTRIPHNLGVIPGFVIIKRIDSTSEWVTAHRGDGNSGEYMYLNLRNSGSSIVWEDSFNESDFDTSWIGEANFNAPGGQYIVYLFAHDESDTGLIQCGSVTSDANGRIPKQTLGWEPQFILRKKANGSDDWQLQDTLRGLAYTNGEHSTANSLYANSNSSEVPGHTTFSLVADGFYSNANFGVGQEFMYMAIRAPMLKEPESADEVFAIDIAGQTEAAHSVAGFPIDMFILEILSAGSPTTGTRLTAPYQLWVNSTNSEQNNSIRLGSNTSREHGISSTSFIEYMWKRAKSFFDVVVYAGDNIASRAVQHSLGATIEMSWVKRKNGSGNWLVSHKDIPANKFLRLNSAAVPLTLNHSVDFTDATFSVGTAGNADYNSNLSGSYYVAYLFASIAGVSKVGYYTGNGSTQTIDCDFTAGARFVLIKRTDASGDWYIWDTTRGIVAGIDPHLSLNTTSAQVTSDDSIDPHAIGFSINQNSATDINVNAAEYIFYAIA